jgi:DNA-binding GntR family transcriptional regulator
MSTATPKTLTRTVSAQLTGLVRARIVSGEYAPGAPLPQDALAAEFGVSKIPVREALLALHADGLVDAFAHRGFQVRPLSEREAQEIFRLRLQIEPQAVAAGARLAQAADRDSARQAYARLKEALSAARLEDSGDLNCAFHLMLILPQRQPLTHEVLKRLLTLAQRYVRLHLQPRGRISRANREHEALLAAWDCGDAGRAQQIARGHIEATHADLARVLAAPRARTRATISPRAR